MADNVNQGKWEDLVLRLVESHWFCRGMGCHRAFPVFLAPAVCTYVPLFTGTKCVASRHEMRHGLLVRQRLHADAGLVWRAEG
jgi:hypothetical protein